MTRTCTKCNVTKELLEFDTSKRAKDGRYSICKLCKRAAHKQWVKANPNKVRQSEINRNVRRRLNVKREMFDRVKRRCGRTKVEFSISIEDIIIPEYCPALGLKLKVSDKGVPSRNSPSLDRIDSTKGYVPGNVQVISYKANTMKNDATEKELMLFAKWILGENSELHKS